MSRPERCAAHSAAVMSPSTSALLDIMRVGAALVVFVYHLSVWWFFPRLGIAPEAGHDAVTLFFVLSGYLIAYSIEGHRCRTGREYALARLSRLYSVVAPALVLTLLLLLIGSRLNPDFYRQFYRGFDGFRFVMASCFMQELWFVSASPPTNAVFWSLSYEFCYYVIFGLWIYGRHRWLGRLLIFGSVLVIGPKILLLFPVWMMGACAYYFGKRIHMQSNVAATGLLITLILFAALLLARWRAPSALGIAPLYHSGWFFSDYVFGMILSLGIVFFDKTFARRSFSSCLAHGAKVCADMRFSLYLYHYPLLIFSAAVVPFDHSNALQALGVAIAVLTAVALLSRITEARRKVFHRWLESIARVLSRISSKLRSKPPMNELHQ